MGAPTKFSQWMRQHLKDAYSGLITQDIDLIIVNAEGKYFITEEKIYATARTGPAQAVIYQMLDEILQADQCFLGCHKATLTRNGVWLDESQTVSLDEFVQKPNAYANGEWYKEVVQDSLRFLWDGKGNPPRKKTEAERTFIRKSALEPLLRREDVEFFGIDWIFVNYVTGNFVLLSENQDFDNPVIQRIISQFEEYNQSSRAVRNPKSKCLYKFLGMYKVEYSEDMSEFWINGNYLDEEDAIRILNLDSNEIEKYS